MLEIGFVVCLMQISFIGKNLLLEGEQKGEVFGFISCVSRKLTPIDWAEDIVSFFSNNGNTNDKARLCQ